MSTLICWQTNNTNTASSICVLLYLVQHCSCVNAAAACPVSAPPLATSSSQHIQCSKWLFLVLAEIGTFIHLHQLIHHVLLRSLGPVCTELVLQLLSCLLGLLQPQPLAAPALLQPASHVDEAAALFASCLSLPFHRVPGYAAVACSKCTAASPQQQRIEPPLMARCGCAQCTSNLAAGSWRCGRRGTQTP